MRERIKTTGFRELAKALRDLPAAVRTRVLARAARAGAKPVESRAKVLAPVLKEPDPRRRAGTLKGAIKTSRMRDPSIDGVAVKVHVPRMSGKKVVAFKQATGKAASDNPDDPFYGRFLEFGTSKMSAQPFLRPALVAERHTAIEKIRAETAKGVERETRRLARK